MLIHKYRSMRYEYGYNGVIFPSAKTGGTNYVFFYSDAELANT